MSIINWIKNNKFSTVLICAIVILFYYSFINTPRYGLVGNIGGLSKGDVSERVSMMGIAPSIIQSESGFSQPEPISNQDRKFVAESNISLLVKNVKDTEEQIQNKVAGLGGYVVNTNYINPDIASTGSITLRIPIDKVQTLKTFLIGNSVRVVSENISGHDITNQYTDTQSRLDTLYKTKIIFENILIKAVNVDEILRVQQAILSVQDQIDSLKGSVKYMDETSKTMLITINLSTDELALPYAPNDPWRPNVIFKTAVRSVVTHARGIGSGIIWIAVYSIIYIPLIIIFTVTKKFLKSRKS